ncbi:hypothetical protein [Priestia koreensis]|uniref:hypothetical protein n=1 Tax=Priestia koreensis TaxID=284581 RepID=UPI001F58B13C|nr:hypothetical protein [Priestia koreensis]UNL87038.1 hypothetical protein IE339_11375 [Priestia koreensis]
MKRILIVTLVALLSIFFIDRSYSKQNQAQAQEKFIHEVKQEQQQSDVATVNLNKVFHFHWDKVYVFEPHTKVASINKKLGFDWMEAKATGIESGDNSVIVFVKNNQVEQFVTLPTSYGQPVYKNKHECEIKKI